ncbi:GNAT family N-acetyltransferase [Streptomyces sp. NPDC017936]|uniref:GNAT family N-acetyltransferase n=1 Tax=Streptomyces sp. NPDC017936 TaxID=3365016 RepID=UPI00379C544C
MAHVIEVPHAGDAAFPGPLRLRTWLQTYPNEAAGINETWIREHRGASATAEGTAQWRQFIEAAGQQPDLLFCRVVRSEAEIVGFLCGRRDEVVSLGPLYLLNEAQGQGVGGRMTNELFTWAGSSPIRLCACGSPNTTSERSTSTSATDSRPQASERPGEENCQMCA